LKRYSLGMGDEVFPTNMPTSQTYILVHGELVYSPAEVDLEDQEGPSFQSLKVVMQRSASALGHVAKDRDSSAWGKKDVGVQYVVHVTPGTWLSEAAMVMDWTTCGSAEAHDSSELVGITRDVLEVITKRTPCARILRGYCKSYKMLVETTPCSRLNDIDPPVKHALAILLMESQSRMAAAQPVLHHLQDMRARQWLQTQPEKGNGELEEEVREGACALIFNDEGNPTRVALIVTLRATRDDGLMLAQIAKMSAGVLVPKLQMPATKLKEGEGPANAAQRLLTSKLKIFGTGKSLGSVAQDEQVRVVAAYDLETIFLRTIFTIPFEPSEAGPVPIRCDGPVSFERPNHSVLNEEASDVFNEFLPEEFYLIEKDGNAYAWIDPEVFDLLQGNEEFDPVLAEWVENMVLESSEEKRTTVCTEKTV